MGAHPRDAGKLLETALQPLASRSDVLHISANVAVQRQASLLQTDSDAGDALPGATTATPYGPSFGSATGILRATGSYKSPTYPAPTFGDVGYLYDGANAPGQQLTTLIANGGTAFNTIGHSNFISSG